MADRIKIPDFLVCEINVYEEKGTRSTSMS